MTYDILLMVRSGREYKLTVSDEQLDELFQHKDIGSRRVFVIGQSMKAPEDIPWHKIFPGTKLYRVKADMPKAERKARKSKKPVFMSAALGPIEYYSCPDTHLPEYIMGVPM